MESKPVNKMTGLYIVSETACLRPGSGAYRHIKAGMEELDKYFSIKQVLFCKPYEASVPNTSAPTAALTIIKNGGITKSIKAFVKWPVQLIKNHASFFSYYRKIKDLCPDFIYERSSYLNYNGLIISKLMHIPHFYEVNGICAHDNRKYFPGIWNKLAAWMEKAAYKRSNIGFYVGGINFQMGIANPRSIVVQNGIEKEFTEKFINKEISVNGVLHVAFIGYLMDHHRLEVLCNAFQLVSNKKQYHLHLIGSGMEALLNQLPSDLAVTCHGQMDHDAIGVLLNQIHVGVIPYALEYYSNVKTFLYGAGKLATIVPEARNFKEIFSTEEAVFIKNADEKDLAAKMEMLKEDPQLVVKFGNNLFRKVRNEFTWEQIFKKKAEHMKEFIRSVKNN